MIASDGNYTKYYNKSSRVCVYSTDDNIHVEFNDGNITAGAWIPENTARELILLLAAVVNGQPKEKNQEEVEL